MYIFYFLLFTFTSAYFSNPSYFELKKMLTNKDLQSWLYNQTNDKSLNPYCKLCCIKVGYHTIGKKCGQHTLCIYPIDKTGAACRGYINIGFTHNEQQAILDAHNTLRNFVASGNEERGNPGPQPPAANMRALEWNAELTLVAERWAAQCLYANDICRDLERFPVGQNIAHGNLAANNELSFVKDWYDDVAYFNSSDVESFKLIDRRTHIAGKYTQLVWADTYQIGCARAVFQQSQGASVAYREHLICNYGPTGNIPNQPVYIVGPPCSACHEGTSCTLEYPALCSGEVINKLIEDRRPVATTEVNKGSNGVGVLYLYLSFTYGIVYYILVILKI